MMQRLAAVFALILSSPLAFAEAKPADVIELESNVIGDKEQPAMSYSLPWQGPEGPEKLYRDIDSFNDFLLQPVDRDQMLRSIRFYNEMQLENSNPL